MSGVYLDKGFNAAHHNIKIEFSPPFEKSKTLQETIHSSHHGDKKREETNNDQTNIWNLNDNHRRDRNVSACIEVPNATRRSRKTSEEPTMTDLMAAMVLNNLSCSPGLCSHLTGSSPRSYESSGVGSWSQDSRRTSPFHLIVPSKIPPYSKQDFDSGVTFDQKSPLCRSRSRSDISDMDPGTILLQGSTPTPREEEEESEDADENEPKDFSMKTLLAKEEEELRKKLSSSRGKKEDTKDDSAEQASKNIFFNPGNYTFPNVSQSNRTLIPPQISIPYYFPPPLLSNPFHASLPNDFLLRLASTPPTSLPNADLLGSSAPGLIDGTMQRFSRRAAPYYKINDDSPLSSPRHSTSPSSFTLGSAPDSYRFSNSLMVPGSNFSLSPTRYRKATRSPVTPKPPTSPYSSPSRGPPTTPHLSLPTDISGFQSMRDHYPSERLKSTYIQNHVTSLNKRSNHPQAVSKSFTQGHHFSNSHSKTSSAVSAESIPLPIGRKVPGDGKKCRKVYGMENKDIWCTSCRWKKACQRFPD